jgi:hypothetical protein
VIVWTEAAPPRRGTYPVRRTSSNAVAGYRYWDGERWGILCHTYKGAQHIKTTGRRRPMRTVHWGRTIQGNG